jgi:hypothetical protein
MHIYNSIISSNTYIGGGRRSLVGGAGIAQNERMHIPSDGDGDLVIIDKYYSIGYKVCFFKKYNSRGNRELQGGQQKVIVLRLSRLVQVIFELFRNKKCRIWPATRFA